MTYSTTILYVVYTIFGSDVTPNLRTGHQQEFEIELIAFRDFSPSLSTFGVGMAGKVKDSAELRRMSTDEESDWE